MKPRKELIGASNIADRRRIRRRKPVGTGRQRAGGNRRSRNRVRRLLVPIDFSSGSLRALDYAMERARETGGAIILLHVLEPMVVSGPYEGATLWSMKAEFRRDVKQRLEKLAKERTSVEVPIKAWLLKGMPGEKIVEAAEKTGSDTIIMGSVGRKGLRRLLLGSVAEAVVRHADVPVTIIREPRKRKQRARAKPRG
jgi:nucleotide-binding universal stress UspA family protein